MRSVPAATIGSAATGWKYRCESAPCRKNAARPLPGVLDGEFPLRFSPDDRHLAVGTEVELVVDVLYEDDDHEYLVWKWRPVTAGSGGSGA